MILGVTPARLNSTRFPKKVTYNLNNKSIIQHVYDKTCKSKFLDKVIVAVDSEEVIDCLDNPRVAMMTLNSHKSGTDRVAEVANKFDCDIVVNIQGDEPGIDPLLIDDLIKLFEQGIDHYFKQEWKIAVNKFKQAENLEDKFESRNTTPSQIYIERCEMFMKNPPEKDWDGVWKMTSK